MCGTVQCIQCSLFHTSVYLCDVCVIHMQWHGAGGFSRCEGTSKEEALQNMALREAITAHEDVTIYYRRFMLEDGSIVLFDAALVFAQVKQCLNDLKRHGKTSNSTHMKEEVHVIRCLVIFINRVCFMVIFECCLEVLHYHFAFPRSGSVLRRRTASR